MTGARPIASKDVLLVTGAWLVAAYLVGAAGFLHAARPPMPQILLLALTGAILVLFWRAPAFRRWVLDLDVRALVMIHITRVVAGVDFLIRYRRGELPYDFAVPGGWGDIAVGLSAIAVCALARPELPRGRLSFLLWNAAGLLDILFVVATASRLALAEPASMSALLRLPLSLLPTFLVPIIIATHVMIFARLRRPVGAR
jgi:hypothetical protein